ncbi:MAG: T9SS type A sorting domain-containing protein [Flavobacteriales bacterium]|nr:T9SS type A sorting domain-containing protein [Flavobacteriales bacterium]
MNRTLRFSLVAAALTIQLATHAQTRYLQEVFTNSDVVVTADVPYATNIDFLTSNFTVVPPVINTINLAMDIYEPDQGVDGVAERPLVIYLHTGNLLPPPFNSSPNGTRKDSSAVENCRRMARRGYVAASVSYRLGWNPTAADVQTRRGTLLNAVYRAIHDTKMAVRWFKANADGANTYGIDPDKIILVGEGTGGYITLAYSTLDDPAELFIEKFRPDPFDPSVSYVDTCLVGNIDGFCPATPCSPVGCLNLYTPNGYDADVQFCVNLGGALADTSWLAPGDVPMVSLHTVRDDFAPFDEGIVYVPVNPPLEVVELQGANVFIPLANSYGNNDAFATLPDGDPFTDRARALYGTTWDVSNGGTLTIASAPEAEGLFPIIRPLRPFLQNEASPWQWWDPTSPLALTVVSAGPPPVTAHQAASASNPDMSANKGRTYIDTVMGYINPRIVCALDLGPCSLVGVNENEDVQGLELFPNPANERVNVASNLQPVTFFQVFDMNGRLVQEMSVNSQRFTIERQGLKPGAYFVKLHFANGAAVRKLMLD